MTRKHSWRIGLAALLAVSLSACGDEGASPLAPRSINAALTSDTVVTEFTVWPGGGKYNIAGTHRIVFPAAAICDLATSGYGAKLWDAPCVPSALPVRITAKSWLDASGHPQVDFQPAMRFSPTLGDGVQLFLMDKKSAYDPSAKILYCAGTTSSTCVDESLTDPSLATRTDAPNGFVYRRIKHFSGYNVTAGRAVEEVSVDGIAVDGVSY